MIPVKKVLLKDNIIEKKEFDGYSLKLMKKYEYVGINQLITFVNIIILINDIAFKII